MREDNIRMLDGTLNVCTNGKYFKNGKTVFTKLNLEQMEECKVYLPDEIEEMKNIDLNHTYNNEDMKISCKNIDSFSMAQEVYETEKDSKILVLNFANPVNPGGGVRRGARAQEEDLCRKSSLLLSLESNQARKYYRYNRSLRTYMGSDAIILTPNVEILRDVEGRLLDNSILVSVLTCAAPMIRNGLEGLSYEEYTNLFYQRINGILTSAAYLGYECLVLGAFGCGAFRNDAKLVSDLFYKAIKEFNYNDKDASAYFKRIDFAVLDNTYSQYNFNEFSRNFRDFKKERK